MTIYARLLTVFPLVVALAAPAFAAETRAPLVVIRFNQPNVYYAQQLHGAISKAVETKPAVMIDVVSRAPVTGIAENDRKWQKIAGVNTKRVIDDMKIMGVPADRITVRGESRDGITSDETLIYVR